MAQLLCFWGGGGGGGGGGGVNLWINCFLRGKVYDLIVSQ